MMFAVAALGALWANAPTQTSTPRCRRPVDPDAQPDVVTWFCGPQSRCANGWRERKCRTTTHSPRCRGADEGRDGFVRQNSCRKPHEQLGEEVSAGAARFRKCACGKRRHE